MENQPPSIGRIVHYVSYGTPDGEFKSEHRAAIIAAVPFEKSEQARDLFLCDLVVFNPQGVFFNRVPYDSDCGPGTWHWPERV